MAKKLDEVGYGAERSPEVQTGRGRVGDVVVRRDRLRVDPIRLNNMPLLSLDSEGVPDSWAACPEALAGPLVVDWAGFGDRLPLTHLERRVFLACWRDGHKVARVHRILGITPRAAVQAYAAVLELLPRSKSFVRGCLSVAPARDSLRLAYREMRADGRRSLSWSLGRLDAEFQEVLASERNYFYTTCQPVTTVSRKSGEVCAGQLGVMKMEKLKNSLVTESAKLGRLSEAVHIAHVAHDEAERLVQRLEAELKADEVAAAFEERSAPSPALRTKLETARVALIAASEKVPIQQAAHEKQKEIVEAIEAEIHGRRYEALAAAVAGPRAKAFAAMEAFITASLALREVAIQYGFTAVPNELTFPDFAPSDPFTGFGERERQRALLNGAGELADYRKVYFAGSQKVG